MKEYKFYGWRQADVSAVSDEYKVIKIQSISMICFQRFGVQIPVRRG